MSSWNIQVYDADRTWHEAKAACARDGNILAEINSQAENDVLQALSQGDDVWIGLNDLDNEGQFVWDGTGGEPTFAPWESAQPDNFEGLEHCVHLRGSRWNDQRCDYRLPKYACLLFPSPPPSSPCYFQVHLEASVTWQEAQAACAGDGNTLAVINSAAENNQLLEISQDIIVWIGLNDIETEGTFVWESTGETPAVTFWGPGEPNNSGGEDCATFQGGTGIWNDLQCGARRAYACSPPPPPYYVQVYEEGPLNWAQARARCAVRGGTLAMITSQAQQDVVTDLAAGRLTWIGLNDVEAEGAYLWDGCDEEVTYTDWDSNNPSNSLGREDCVHLLALSITGYWNDNDCAALLP
eukprot:5367452-Pleurochrysis_carterae.AAC.3